MNEEKLDDIISAHIHSYKADDLSISNRCLDIDSTFRNRDEFPSPYDFVIRTANLNSEFLDPVLESAPYTGAFGIVPGTLFTQLSGSSSAITLSASDTDIDNYYIHSTLQIGTDFRTITSYIGSTRVANVSPPFTIIPPPGTQYFIRKLSAYFSSNVSVYNIQNNSVDQLNLLFPTPSLQLDYYTNSYIRFTNGPHINSIVKITRYVPTLENITWSQPSSPGSNAFISTTIERGFLIRPTITGIIDSITLNFTAYDNTNPTRTLQLQVRLGPSLNSILYSNTFTVNTTLTPTDVTFNIKSGQPILYTNSQYTITLLDMSSISTGYINMFGIPADSEYITYNGLIVYPKVTINVSSLNNLLWNQLNINPLLLDNISTPSNAAYSLRKLRNSYSGPCIRVRRDSDNMEFDIGFINNELDMISLKSVVGTSNGYISLWYDQSGSGNTIGQSIQSLQPRIINTGIIENISNIPVINFDGIDDYMTLSTYPLTGSTSCTISLVCKVNTTQISSKYFDIGGSTTVYFYAEPNSTAASNIRFGINDGGGEQNTVGTVTDLNNHVLTFNNTGSFLNITQDRILLSSTATTIAPLSVSGNNNFLGKSHILADPYLNGYLQEIIFFQSTLSSGDQLSIEYDQKQYYNTP